MWGTSRVPILVRSGPGNTRTREELATPIAGVVTDGCADGAVAIDRPEGSRESMRASVREEMRV